ncbi:MAG: hypothetical protein ACI9BF_000415 [Candidatus Paceibacteria bacterium]|jgi:hypothetical protein
MLQALQEVLMDLWRFMFRQPKHSHGLPLLTPEPQSSKESMVKDRAVNSLSGVIAPSTDSVSQSLGRVAYVKSGDAICLSGPKFVFDTKIKSLSYGDEVVVTRTLDSFAEIETGGVRGWVEVKVLSDDIQQVFPNLKSNQIYEFNNDQTIKLRKYINDETLAHLLLLPLQSTEYVLYMLKRSGSRLVWPPIRPREPGALHKILRGVKGAVISIEPRTRSIFEYVGDEESSFLGYVEAVHPDLSIKLHSVGRLEDGEYLVEEFTHDEWKEWRPIFVSFT